MWPPDENRFFSLLAGRLEPVADRELPKMEMSLTPSAVAVPLFSVNGDIHLLLTKRSQGLAHHKGQIAFPGGVWEESDGSLVETALRETREEVGIPEPHFRVLGLLKSVVTPTGFSILPVVVQFDGACDPMPNPDEIERTFFIPFSHFRSAPQVSIDMPEYPLEDGLVWGATARIIHQLVVLSREEA